MNTRWPDELPASLVLLTEGPFDGEVLFDNGADELVRVGGGGRGRIAIFSRDNADDQRFHFGLNVHIGDIHRLDGTAAAISGPAAGQEDGA